LTGGVELTVGDETVLEPGEVVVLVGFDPTDARRATMFRQRSGVGQAVRLIGPWANQLSDVGEQIGLTKPIEAGAGRMLADQIVYQSASPWPAIDGNSSLHRANHRMVGSSASNWRALQPNPGITDFVLSGDMSQDGQVDLDDVSTFALGLADPAAYIAAFGLVPDVAGDLDADGDLDFDDIPISVELFN